MPAGFMLFFLGTIGHGGGQNRQPGNYFLVLQGKTPNCLVS